MSRQASHSEAFSLNPSRFFYPKIAPARFVGGHRKVTQFWQNSITGGGRDAAQTFNGLDPIIAKEYNLS